MNGHDGNDAAFLKKYGDIFRKMKVRMRKDCPEAEVIVRYFKGEFSPEDHEAVKEHIELCPVCTEVLQILAQADKMGKEVRLPENWEEIERELDGRVYGYLRSKIASAPVPSAGNRWELSFGKRIRIFLAGLFRPAPAARHLAYAGLFVFVLIAGLYSYAFLSRSELFSLARIEPEGFGTLRGSGARSELFREGVAAFNQGDYRDAQKAFRAYLSTLPDHFQANFLLGLSFLMDAETGLPGVHFRFSAGKVQQGIRQLERSLQLVGDNAYYREDCLWYLAKAHLMQGDMEKARQRLEQLLQLPQPNLVRKDQARGLIAAIEKRRSGR